MFVSDIKFGYLFVICEHTVPIATFYVYLMVKMKGKTEVLILKQAHQANSSSNNVRMVKNARQV